MELKEIIDRIDAVLISNDATISQLKHEDDDELYQVWIIDSNNTKYIFKEASVEEFRNYQTFLSILKEGVPTLYQTINIKEKTYLLLEYIDGENLCKCNREKLIHALDALISIQKITWEGTTFDNWSNSFDESLIHRKNRGKYLNDSLLEKAYDKFLTVYKSIPKTLCHDDLLPFNIISSSNKAVLIDFEYCGILPYPTSFARLIAHMEEDVNSLFYMTKEDKDFAIRYYYDNLLKEKGISYDEWLNTLEYFLFYEYCEWVFVGNKYNDTNGIYYQKYLPIAKRQAEKILKGK